MDKLFPRQLRAPRQSHFTDDRPVILTDEKVNPQIRSLQRPALVRRLVSKLLSDHTESPADESFGVSRTVKRRSSRISNSPISQAQNPFQGQTGLQKTDPVHRAASLNLHFRHPPGPEICLFPYQHPNKHRFHKFLKRQLRVTNTALQMYPHGNSTY